MEKLIDLLNEYDEYAFPEQHPHTEYPDGWVDDGDYRYLGHKYILGQQEGLNFSHHASIKNSGLNHLYVISKEFGFIKRLVENDKLDRERIRNRWGDMSVHFTDEQLFIMELSISDNPIQDLISLLK